MNIMNLDEEVSHIMEQRSSPKKEKKIYFKK